MSPLVGAVLAPWRRLLPLVLTLAAAVVTLWPSLRSLLAYWAEVRDYQHGYLIAPLAIAWVGLVLWRFPVGQLRVSTRAFAALAVVLLVWLVAVRGGIDILHQLLWPFALWLAACAVGGWSLGRRLFQPIAFLYFAVPVWDYTLPVLQRLSIFCSERMLAMLGVSAVVTEYHVTIPEGAFAIVEGCSGKRYFMVTLALAWLAIALNRVPWPRAFWFLAASAWLALLMNWVRIVIVIYAGHMSNMQHYLVAVEHETLGSFMFIVLLAVVLLLARRLGGADGTQGVSGQFSADNSTVRLAAILPTLGVLVLTGLLVRRSHAAVAPDAAAFTLPLSTSRWQGPLPQASSWFPDYTGADAERRASYRTRDEAVEVYANLYRTQGAGRELIRYGNNLAAPEGWERPWLTPLRRLGANDLALGSFSIRGPAGDEWLLARTFVVGPRAHWHEVGAKLAYGWGSIWHATPSGVIALAVRCGPANCDRAQAVIADFWDNQGSLLQAMVSAGTGRAQ